MSEVGGRPNEMAEVADMATVIADRILEQHAANSRIPPERFRMLVRLAQMLLDNGEPWPPSVEHVIMEVARRVEEAKPSPASADGGTRGDDVVANLTRALRAMKRSGGQES